MAQQNPEIYESKVEASDEHQDRGILDFLEKKEEENKPEEELSVPDFCKDHVHKAEEMKEEAEAEEKPTPVQKLDRSNSNSSSSSDEEEGKPKQGLKEKIKDKVTGDKTEDHEAVAVEPAEEKKGFMEKIKAKLPGAHKEEETTPVAPTPTKIQEEETEKKGFMDKIKEKLPGHNKDAADAKTVE
ncbi:hypothetical protein ACHQM5_015902 [Ranunculus cassubicifolius]